MYLFGYFTFLPGKMLLPVNHPDSYQAGATDTPELTSKGGNNKPFISHSKLFQEGQPTNKNDFGSLTLYFSET